MGANPSDEAAKLATFRGELEKLDYIDGQTILIEVRYAMGQRQRLASHRSPECPHGFNHCEVNFGLMLLFCK